MDGWVDDLYPLPSGCAALDDIANLYASLNAAYDVNVGTNNTLE
jgi:hypothetical protein